MLGDITFIAEGLAKTLRQQTILAKKECLLCDL